MNANKMSGTTEAVVKSAGMLKSTTEIAKLISNEYLKELELKEYCKMVESDFTKYEKKFQDLIGGKNQSAGIKAEYKNRNKINITNSESLLKALNELYKYKCELKLSYVTIEKELKYKRLKYKKIISDYESAWAETMKNYNKTLVIAELLKIQEENQVLEKEIEKQVKLTASTKIQFSQLKENIEQNFYKKVVKFSKLMSEYTNLLTSQRRNGKNQTFKAQITSRTLDFKLFRAKAPLLTGSDFRGISDDTNIDVTIFDDIVVPSENLESQHLDEDGYSFLQSDLQQISDISEDRIEDLAYLNTPKEMVQSKNKKLLKDLKENSMQDSMKASKVEENESHYFRQQPIECVKEPQVDNHKEVGRRAEENVNQRCTKDKFNENVEGTAGKLKLVKNATGSLWPQAENEDEVVRDMQMDFEESPSEGSYEKQYSIQREMFNCQKTSSVSSEDLPPPGENPNENDASIHNEDQQNKSLKPGSEIETNDFKSFTGFFTMGNDNENPTPSIFKLF